MHISKTGFCILSLASFLISIPAFGQGKQSKCDEACKLEIALSVFQEIDVNNDEVIDKAELAALKSTVGTSKTNSDARGSESAVKKDDKVEYVKSGILIRAAYEPVSVLNAPKDFKKASGAQLSVVNNFDNDEYTITASGAVEAYRSWQVDPATLSDQGVIPSGTITDVAVNFGAVFNRKINSANTAKDLDSLTFRAGGEIAVQGIKNDFHFLRASIFDATDFDFDTQVIGAQAEWEPVYLPLGIGVAPKIPGLPVFYRWKPVLHAEYQHVLDAGGNTKLADASDYLFAGPILSGQLFFSGPLQRLTFDTTYWAMWDILGNADPFQYFEFAGNWTLDEDGHFALSAKYRNGNIPKTRQAVDDITVGLTVKY